MHTVGAAEAKAKISELLDRVGAGEPVPITRLGEVAALLMPPERLRKDKSRLRAEIRRFRTRCTTGEVNI